MRRFSSIVMLALACAACFGLVDKAAAQASFFRPNRMVPIPPLPAPVQKGNISYDADFDSVVLGAAFPPENQGNFTLHQALNYGGVPVQVWNVPYYEAVPTRQGVVYTGRILWTTVLSGPPRNPGTSAPKMQPLAANFMLDDLQHAATLTLNSGAQVNLTAVETFNLSVDLPRAFGNANEPWTINWGDNDPNLGNLFDQPLTGRYYIVEGEFGINQVPEPSSAALAMIVGAFILRRR